MKQSKRIAECGMTAALAVVIMIIGGILGIGLYASPMFAGLLLLPIGRKYGAKYHAALWLAVSLLSFLTVPEIEQNLVFLCFFGCYPLLYPRFMRIRRTWLRRACKFLYFNLTIIAVEALVIFVLVPEVTGTALLLVMLLLFNLIFIGFDRIIPYFELIMKRYLEKLKKK